MIKTTLALFASIMLLSMLSTSCYKDNEEELYGAFLAACDTTAISFDKDIKPIFGVSCDNCHSTAAAPILGAGINLDGAARIATYETNFPGRLLGSISHIRPYSPMPKGSRKLDNCSITKVEAWLKAGAPNN